MDADNRGVLFDSLFAAVIIGMTNSRCVRLNRTSPMVLHCFIDTSLSCLLNVNSEPYNMWPRGIQGRERQMSSLTSWTWHTGHFNSIKAQLKKQKSLGFAFSGSHLVKFWQLSHI